MKLPELWHWIVTGHKHQQDSTVLTPAWVAHGAPYLVEAERCACGYLRVPGGVWKRAR